MPDRFPTEAERRDDLAHELRGTLLITKPTLRCPTDQEAELIATIAVKYFRDLLWRAELKESFLEESAKMSEQLVVFRWQFANLKRSLADLSTAQSRLEEVMPVEKQWISGEFK